MTSLDVAVTDFNEAYVFLLKATHLQQTLLCLLRSMKMLLEV